MLHVHCGDSSAALLRERMDEDPVVVWNELLMQGSLLGDPHSNGFLQKRAAFLSDSTGGARTTRQCASRLRSQQAALGRFREHEETVLWFDACLYDQTILARQLSWFERQELKPRRLSLICVGEQDGVPDYAGLGQLSSDQMLALLPTRKEVTPEQFDVGTAFWLAMRSRTPLTLDELRQEDVSALPYAGEAMERFLQQYPSVHNGLSRLEEEVLQALSGGAGSPTALFCAVSRLEQRPFFGDTTLWRLVNELAALPVPLLTLSGPGPLPLWEPPRLDRWRMAPTNAGRRVLAGREDRVHSHGLDRWIGGVHLYGNHVPWRWDNRRNRIVKGD